MQCMQKASRHHYCLVLVVWRDGFVGLPFDLLHANVIYYIFWHTTWTSIIYAVYMHSCLPHLLFLFIQWLLPAPLSVPRSLPPSPLQNCPLLGKTENAPFALTRRWTRSSTPVDTCVCATTVGWSWSDRSMRAVRYAGGRSKMWSKHIGPDGFNGCRDFTARCHLFPLLRLCWTQILTPAEDSRSRT